jgi:hypothetical protein
MREADAWIAAGVVIEALPVQNRNVTIKAPRHQENVGRFILGVLVSWWFANRLHVPL